MPNTPNSLVERGKPEEAKDVLRRVRGTKDVDTEFKSILVANKVMENMENPWRAIVRYSPADAGFHDSLSCAYWKYLQSGSLLCLAAGHLQAPGMLLEYHECSREQHALCRRKNIPQLTLAIMMPLLQVRHADRCRLPTQQTFCL